MPNGQEKEQARKVIASAQEEAKRIARLESALHAAAGRIEAFRRICFLFLKAAPAETIRLAQEDIDSVFKDPANAKTCVFEVDADTEPGFIHYRIPSAETIANAERVKSIMEHAEDDAARGLHSEQSPDQQAQQPPTEQ
jgi:hypothetical protein